MLTEEKAPHDRDESWQRYDFRQPRRLSRARCAALTEVYQDYARLVSFCISSSMKQPCTVQVLGVEERKYMDFYNRLDDREPVALVRMQPPPLAGGAERPLLLRCWPDLVHSMMLRSLGEGGALPLLARPWTAMERTLCEAVMRQLLSFLEDAWSKLLHAGFSFSGFETAAGILRRVNLNEDCVVISLAVEVGAGQGEITFCLSADALEEVFQVWERDNGPCSGQKSGKESFSSLLKTLMDSELELSAVFGYTRLLMQELTALQTGDVLKVQRPTRDGVELFVEDQHWTCGTLGVYKGSYAVSLTNLANGLESGA